MAGATGMRFNFSRNDVPETPLFQRQLGNDEYVEFQQLRMIIENLQQRVDNLEKINVDLEYRLEEQAKQSMAVEKECLLVEQRWRAQNEELEKEINRWKSSFENEKQKGDKLREHLSRTERELYGILQRKYELMRGPGTNRGAPPGMRQPSGSDIAQMKRNDAPSSASWDADLFMTGKPMESKKARERKVVSSLSDFLGF